ncbi:hypothetical protein [Bathymodiolus platifrons methanotrophic gill symbiont]|nr:hypothetical protein [Bathymodiolus platifrons methanotrophic gill symbiont]
MGNFSTEKANEYNKKGSFENQVGKQFAFIFISVSIESNNS